MYEGLDIQQMTERQKELHRIDQVNQNPDVLFRIYSQGRLHILSFDATEKSWWMGLILTEYNRISAQWNIRHVNQPFRTMINLTGKAQDLEMFCDSFPNHLERCQEEVNEIQHRNGRIHDLEAEIQDLQGRIQDLELENRRRRQQ